jgi:hypothetical protein
MDEAEAAYRDAVARAIASCPDARTLQVAIARYMLACHLLQRGNAIAAFAEAESAIREDKRGHDLLHAVAAEALRELGRDEEARAAAVRAIRDASSDNMRANLASRLAGLLPGEGRAGLADRVRLSKKLQRAVEITLDEFVSRRTEYRRYWLFGFLVEADLDLQIDLLVGPPLTAERPVDVAKRRAEDVFERRLNDASVRPGDLTSARLTIRTQGAPTEQAVDGAVRRGQEMTFRISVVHEGALYEAERTDFVAHHDPAIEQKSEPPFDEGEGRDT